MTQPYDLLIGDLIPAGDFGALTVVRIFPMVAIGDWAAVDVEPGPNADIWDMKAFALAVNAEEACWLSNTPRLLYRLYFSPETEIEVAR